MPAGTDQPESSPSRLLEIERLRVTYDGVIEAVHEASLHVDKGEIVALLGANGAGKTTLLRAVTGLTRYHGATVDGVVRFHGERMTRINPARVVRQGVAQVMEGRRIFAELSVRDNLHAGGITVRRRGLVAERLEHVLTLFPVLRDRLDSQAGYLSGGEQQMLAIGRALMSGPELLLLDEPSLGLAPLIVEQMGELIREINREGTTILLVEQNAALALSLADRAYVLETGRIVREGPADELADDPAVRDAYLGVGGDGQRSLYRATHAWRLDGGARA